MVSVNYKTYMKGEIMDDKYLNMHASFLSYDRPILEQELEWVPSVLK